MLKVLLIGLGGGLGAIFRHIIGSSIQDLSDLKHFPIGILIVNVIGCFAIGLINVLIESKFNINEEFRMMIFVGVLGGFTTFSSFGMDTYNLFKNGYILYAIFNILASLILGLLAVWLGYLLGKQF